MTTAAPSAALAAISRHSPKPERLALAGFLAGYPGLTRDAYALDLRKFTAWCRGRSLACSSSAGPTSRCSPGTSKPGRARATITRLLFPIAGCYRYAVEETCSPLTGRPCQPSADRLRVPCHRLRPQRVGALLVAAGLGTAAEHALLSLLALNGLGFRRPPARTSSPGPGTRAPDARHTRKGGEIVSSRLPRAPPGRSTWPSANAPKGRCSRRGRAAAGPAGRADRPKTARRAGMAKAVRLRTLRTRSSPPPWMPGCRCGTSRTAWHAMPHHHAVRPGPRQPGPARHLRRRRLPRRARQVTRGSLERHQPNRRG